MGSLTHCLTISALPKEETDHIRDMAKRLREEDGLSHQDAAIAAVESVIAEYTGEHQDIVSQVESAGGIAPDEWLLEPKKAEEIVEPVKEPAKPELPPKAIEKPTEVKEIVEKPVEEEVKAKPEKKRIKDEDITDEDFSSIKLQEAVEGKSAIEVAEHIIKTSSNKSYVLIAKKIKSKLNELASLGIDTSFSVVHEGDMAPIALRGARGISVYNFKENKSDIWIKGVDFGELSGISHEVILHELIHSVTQASIYFGNLKANKNTELGRNISDLYSISNEIIKYSNNRYRDYKANKIEISEFEHKLYGSKGIFINAIKNPHEIVAWGLSNPDFQKYLDGIKYKNDTVWGSFVNTVRKLLGLSPSQNTALSEILRVSELLISEPSENLLIYAKKSVSKGKLTAKIEDRKETDKDVALYSKRKAEAFKKWFGDSKVVDEKGDPLIVYHGTSANIDAFDMQFAGQGPSKFGFWMTDDRGFSEMFGEKQMPLYLKIVNPKIISTEKWNDIRTDHARDGAWFSSWREKLKLDGHDGLFIKGGKEMLGKFEVSNPNIYAAFDPEQIKSAENIGTFDPTDPRIKYARGEAVASTTKALTDTLLAGRFKKPAQKMLDTGKLEIVQSEADLPKDARLIMDEVDRYIAEAQAFAAKDQAKNKERLERVLAGGAYSRGEGIAGAYIDTKDKIYIVADNVSESEIESVLLHEGFHGRWRDVLGKAQADRLEKSIERIGKTESEWYAKAKKAVPEDTPAEFVTEEIMAYAVEQYESAPTTLPERIKKWVKDFIAAIKIGLIRMGMKPKDITPADLSAIARSSLKRFAVTEEVGELAPKFMRKAKEPKAEKPPPRPDEGITRLPKKKKAWDGLVDGFIYNFVNRFKDLGDIQKELGDIPEVQDAALAEELFSGRARKRLDDLDDFHVRPLLQAIDDADMTLEDVGRYLHARHAEEANKVLKARNPDRKDNESLSGMSNTEAKKILSEFAKNPAIKDIARKVDAINKARQEKLVQDGLVSQGQIDSWNEMYKNYIPLHRDQVSSEEGVLGDLPPTGTGYHISGKEVKLRAGSTKEVDHRLIIPHIVSNYEASAIRGEKNLVGQTLYELVKNNPDPDMWSIDEYDTYMKLDKNGVVVEQPDTRMHDNELGVKIEGELHRISFNKENPKAMRLVREMKNLQQREMPKFLRHVHTVMRFLSAVNTSYNPEFVISNFARDLQTAGYNLGDTDIDGLQSRILKDAVKHGIKGMWQNLRHKHDSEWAKYADEFERAGGMVGWLDNYDSIEDRAKAIEREMQLVGNGAAPRKAIRALTDFVSDVNGAIENAVRLSSFVHARRNGISPKKAASLAKNLTVNFNRKGAQSQYFNLAYLFFNASVQGSARMLSAIYKSKKVRGMVGATILFSLVMDMLNRGISGEDDDDRKYYDKIPDTVKDRNLIIMTGEGADDFVKIPLPWGYNVFHVIGQTMGRAADSNQIQGYTKAKEAGRLMSSITEAFNPMSAGSFLQSVSPTLLDPAVKVAENKEWHGGPLMPEDSPFGAPTPRSERYFRSASEQSKWIAEELNSLTGGNKVRPGWWDWSPEWFDMIVGDALGGTGTFFMKIGDTAKKAYTGEELERKNIPFIRKIIGSEYPSADYELYFERVNDISILEKELKEYRGDKNRVIRARHKDKIRMIPILKSSQKRLKILRKRKRTLEGRGAPKSQINSIDDKILAEIKRFNKRYNDIASD